MYQTKGTVPQNVIRFSLKVSEFVICTTERPQTNSVVELFQDY
jgi:hypothetical protein